MATIEESTKTRRTRKSKKETQIVTTEREDLNVHVDICQMRYQQLDERIGRVENHVATINQDLQAFKTEVRESFDEVKQMLSRAKDERFKTMVTAAASVIVGLLGLIGYIVIHLPK